MTWADDNYSYKKSGSIDYRYVSGQLSDFPVLINITDADLEKCRPDGNDIKFYDNAEGTKLNHELIYWDSVTGTLKAWVKLPGISGNEEDSTGTYSGNTFYMYYGNESESTPQSNRTGTWNSDYIMVHHMSGSSVTLLTDSTSHHYDFSSTKGTSPTFNQTGKIYKAVLLNADYIVISGTGANPRDTSKHSMVGSVVGWPSSLTMEMWLNHVDPVGDGYLVNKSTGILDIIIYTDDDKLTLHGWQGANLEMNAAHDDGNWHHIAATYGSSSSYPLQWYYNGGKDASNSVNGSLSVGTGPIFIGGYYTGDYLMETTYIEEFRIAYGYKGDIEVPFPAGWMKTNYNTMASSSKFVLFGVEQTPPTIPSSYTNVDIYPNTIRIYYSGSRYPLFYIGCPCKRWDENNWNIAVETVMDSSNRDILFSHVVPGALRELYNILGTPKFIDSTYNSSNTLIVEPQYGYGISSLRQKRIVAVKSIQDTFVNPKYFGIKIEGTRLDT